MALAKHASTQRLHEELRLRTATQRTAAGTTALPSRAFANSKTSLTVATILACLSYPLYPLGSLYPLAPLSLLCPLSGTPAT